MTYIRYPCSWCGKEFCLVQMHPMGPTDPETDLPRYLLCQKCVDEIKEREGK